MRGDLFKGILQWELEGNGIKGKVPIFYQDNTSLTAVFTASTKKVTPYLPHPDMHVVEAFPGRCLVGFTAFEYRQSDINPYNEFSIAIIITFGRRPIVGTTILSQMMRRSFSAYVWHLPVTTEIARAPGVELYGYPKFLADIDFRRNSGQIDCGLSEKGTPILTLHAKTLPTASGRRMRYRTYSVKGGVPLCANMYTAPTEFGQTLNGNASWLEIAADHPISKKLQGISLSKKPLLTQYSPVNEAILFGPRNLIDD